MGCDSVACCAGLFGWWRSPLLRNLSGDTSRPAALGRLAKAAVAESCARQAVALRVGWSTRLRFSQRHSEELRAVIDAMRARAAHGFRPARISPSRRPHFLRFQVTR